MMNILDSTRISKPNHPGRRTIPGPRGGMMLRRKYSTNSGNVFGVPPIDHGGQTIGLLLDLAAEVRIVRGLLAERT